MEIVPKVIKLIRVDPPKHKYGCVAFTVKNSHRNDKFGLDLQAGQDYFRADNNILILSNYYPAIDDYRFYVQGKHALQDNAVLITSKSMFAKISAAVDEYNRKAETLAIEANRKAETLAIEANREAVLSQQHMWQGIHIEWPETAAWHRAIARRNGEWYVSRSIPEWSGQYGQYHFDTTVEGIPLTYVRKWGLYNFIGDDKDSLILKP